MPARLLFAVFCCLAIAGCSSGMRQQSNDAEGDTFVLINSALESNDPVTRSWVAYSLAISACQLRIGGDNPAQATSFNCEVTARRLLLDEWTESDGERPEASDAYLDKLVQVQNAGYLSEYVVRYFTQKSWDVPEELDMYEFRVWSVENLYRHQPETRMTGSWSYSQ